MKVTRKIIQIDETRCDGCGQCVPACAEGTLEIIDGKAKLISDVYCDGLGACLGHCPQGALKVITREADAFDEEAVKAHLERSVAAATAARTVGRIPTAHVGRPFHATRCDVALRVWRRHRARRPFGHDQHGCRSSLRTPVRPR